MKLSFCCMAICLAVSLSSFGQEKNQSVIAAAGDVSKSATIILEWTVGEPAVETITSPSSILTQGFHQPLLQVQKISATKEAVASKNTFRVYPNPATSIINIEPEKISDVTLLISLVDINGKVIMNNNLPAKSAAVKLNVTNLSQGTYFLRISNAAGVLQGEYKIIKAQ